MGKLASFGFVVALALSAQDAAAFDLKHTPNGKPLAWMEAQVTFVVDPSIEAAVPGGASAVESAVAGWSRVAGAPTLVTSEGPGGAKVAVDGRNSILLAPEGYAPAGNALAVTVLSYDDDTGALVDADIVINGIHAFAVLAAGAKGASGSAVSIESMGDDRVDGAFDLEHVVAHEVGHALGLGDVEQDGALMYAYSAPGDASNRAPAEDDTQGIAALYDPAQVRPGCAQASVAGLGGATGGGWASAAPLAGVGLALARRRRRMPINRRRAGP